MKRLVPFGLLALCACQPTPEEAPEVLDCQGGGDTQLLLLSQIAFPREVDGVSPGFDLDGEVTEAGGVSGCGVADMTSPTGETGIDNAFARLRPALDLTEASALELIIQEAINSGGLLATVQLDDLHHPTDDQCVDLTVKGALGEPLIGADGIPLPGQTFDPDPSTEPSVLTDLVLSAGEVEGGPVDMSLPFFFLDADVVFEITNSRIRMTQDAEGNWTGVLGGGLPTQALQDLAYNTGIGEEVEQLLDSLLGLVADLNPDENGECQDISVTLEFEAVPAFWFNASDY